MESRIQLVAILGSVALLLTVLELVRRRRLLERYAVLWIFSATILVLLSVWSNLLHIIASHIGIATPSNALFAVGLGFVSILLLHFSLAVSRLADQSKILAQRVALLQERLAEAEGARIDPANETPAPTPVAAADSSAQARASRTGQRSKLRPGESVSS